MRILPGIWSNIVGSITRINISKIKTTIFGDCRKEVKLESIFEETNKADYHIMNILSKKYIYSNTHYMKEIKRNTDLDIITTRDKVYDIVNDKNKTNCIRAFLMNTPVHKIIILDTDKIIYRYRKHTLVVKQPQLMWNCSCEPTAKGDYANDCDIHSKGPIGSAIERAFKEHVNEIDIYIKKGFVKKDHISILWQRSPMLWPPSIDTIHFIKVIREEIYKNKRQYASVIDIGAGTGVMGIAYAKFNNNIARLKFTDVFLSSLLWSAINANEELRNRNIPIMYELSYGIKPPIKERKGDKEYELLISNPPYLPIPERFRDMKFSSSIADTKLMEDIIENGGRIARNGYIQLSGLAMKEFENAIRKSKLIDTIEEIKCNEVPFRVHDALLEKEYMKWLIEDRGLIRRKKSKYKYWHRVYVYRIRYK